jgi:hypothetical protein
MTARAVNTLAEEGLSAPMNSSATVDAAGAERSGATTAGMVVLAVQQSF